MQAIVKQAGLGTLLPGAGGGGGKSAESVVAFVRQSVRQALAVMLKQQQIIRTMATS